MLVRTVVLGAILFAVQSARAEETLSDQQLLKQKSAQLDQLQREVHRLREVTGTAQQIVVKVQMLEVGLTRLRNRGVDTAWFADGSISPDKMQQWWEAAGQLAYDAPSESAAEAELNDSMRFVDWLKQENLAKALADPTVTVVSGKSATLFVGNDIPLPTGERSSTAVSFRSVGMELRLHAEALGDNRVRLDVDTSVSSIDQGRGIEINKVIVPGLKVCRCDTGCELEFGETVILTGHVEKRVEAVEGNNGEIKEVSVDIDYMVVVTPEFATPIEGAVVGANHDMNQSMGNSRQ